MIKYPTNINKYKGVIIKNKNSYVFKYKDIIKKFNTQEYENEDETHKQCVIFKKKHSILNKLVINPYKIIGNTLIVYLNKNKKLIVDIQDENLINKYKWKIQNNIKYATTFIPKKDRKDEDKYKTFHEIKFKNRKMNLEIQH